MNEGSPAGNQPKKNKALIISIVVILILAVVGYFALSQFMGQFKGDSVVGQPKIVGGSCENQMKEIAVTTLETLNQIFNFGPEQQAEFTQVYVKEMCDCLKPSLREGDIIAFMGNPENKEFLSQCSTTAGEKAGAAAAGVGSADAEE